MSLYESILKEWEDDAEYVDEEDFEAEDFVGEVKSSKGIYVGDPCYVVYDDVYDEVWGDKYGYDDGVIKSSKGTFVVHGTCYGDGCYGFSYRFPVDSGSIAIVPGELIDEKKVAAYNGGINALGHFFDTANWAAMSYRDGTYKIDLNNKDSFLIDTKNF